MIGWQAGMACWEALGKASRSLLLERMPQAPSLLEAMEEVQAFRMVAGANQKPVEP